MCGTRNRLRNGAGGVSRSCGRRWSRGCSREILRFGCGHREDLRGLLEMRHHGPDSDSSQNQCSGDQLHWFWLESESGPWCRISRSPPQVLPVAAPESQNLPAAASAPAPATTPARASSPRCEACCESRTSSNSANSNCNFVCPSGCRPCAHAGLSAGRSARSTAPARGSSRSEFRGWQNNRQPWRHKSDFARHYSQCNENNQRNHQGIGRAFSRCKRHRHRCHDRFTRSEQVFRRQVAEAARHWKFKPAQVDGRRAKHLDCGISIQAERNPRCSGADGPVGVIKVNEVSFSPPRVSGFCALCMAFCPRRGNRFQIRLPLRQLHQEFLG